MVIDNIKNIVGLYVKIKDGSEKDILRLFNLCKANGYYWYNVLSQNEVWDLSLTSPRLVQEYYGGYDLLENLSNEVNIVFLKLQGYREKIEASNISEYKDFLASDCQIIILVYDCRYIEIFSKDLIFLQELKSTISEFVEEQEYILKTNIRCANMDVF